MRKIFIGIMVQGSITALGHTDDSINAVDGFCDSAVDNLVDASRKIGEAKVILARATVNNKTPHIAYLNDVSVKEKLARD